MQAGLGRVHVPPVGIALACLEIEFGTGILGIRPRLGPRFETHWVKLVLGSAFRYHKGSPNSE